MKTQRLTSILQAVRSLGPYLLVELLLPGGTLVAVLLWLSQHAARRPNLKARPQPVARVAALRLVSSGSQVRRVANALLGTDARWFKGYAAEPVARAA